MSRVLSFRDDLSPVVEDLTRSRERIYPYLESQFRADIDRTLHALFYGSGNPFQDIVVEHDGTPATGAHKLVAPLKFSEPLRELASALCALERDLNVLELISKRHVTLHERSSADELQVATVRLDSAERSDP
jgi:hypothetical protein